MYLEKWGYIIVNGLKRSAKQFRSRYGNMPFKVRFVYVDCFSYSGFYAPENKNGEPSLGSPIIGVKALDAIHKYAEETAGFSPEIFSVLIEQEPRVYRELRSNLNELGYGNRVRETTNFSSLLTNEIALVQGDCLAHIDDLKAFTSQEFSFAFYLLDPYGSKGIPLSMVGPIVSQDRCDVMINFQYLNLERRSGSAINDIPELSEHNRHLDELFGTDAWREIPELYYGELFDKRSVRMEGELVDYYHKRLQDIDDELAIKSIRLRFPDRNRTMFYLFLTTHDPSGALALNEILDKASYREHELRESHTLQVKKGGQVSLFGDEVEDPGKPVIKRPEKNLVADTI